MSHRERGCLVSERGHKYIAGGQVQAEQQDWGTLLKGGGGGKWVSTA